MRQYFRRAHAALAPDGILYLDAYGGYEAFKVRKERTPYRGYTYVWHQAAYDSISGDTLCHIDFKFEDGSRLPRASGRIDNSRICFASTEGWALKSKPSKVRTKAASRSRSSTGARRAPFVRAALVWGVSRPPAHLPTPSAPGRRTPARGVSSTGGAWARRLERDPVSGLHPEFFEAVAQSAQGDAEESGGAGLVAAVWARAAVMRWRSRLSR